MLARLGGLAGAMMATTAGLLSPIIAWAGTRNVDAFDASVALCHHHRRGG
jgi:hypothetical protein